MVLLLVKAFGQVISGKRFIETVSTGDYRRFLRLKLAQDNITEVISVKDSQGNEYYEVEYLSQDVVMSEDSFIVTIATCR